MAQKVNTNKERKENELSEKKKNTPFMQIDKQSDPISNFITDFKSQFREAKGLIDLNSLFGANVLNSQSNLPNPKV